MAQYEIKYIDGGSETITAAKVNIDDDSDVFVFHSNPLRAEAIAIVPKINILSVVRHDDEQATD